LTVYFFIVFQGIRNFTDLSPSSFYIVGNLLCQDYCVMPFLLTLNSKCGKAYQKEMLRNKDKTQQKD
jgi:hypothetical protein